MAFQISLTSHSKAISLPRNCVGSRRKTVALVHGQRQDASARLSLPSDKKQSEPLNVCQSQEFFDKVFADLRLEEANSEQATILVSNDNLQQEQPREDLGCHEGGVDYRADTFPNRWQAISSRLTPSWMSRRMKGLGLLWVLVALCATNWVLVKDSGGLDTLTFSAARFTIAAAAFLPFLPRALLSKSNKLLPAGLELGFWTAAGYLTQALGLMTTDASRASFISSFTVLAVPFLASSQFGDGRSIKWTVWLSAAVALVGVGLLEQGGGSAPGVGDLWSFASAIVFGIQIYRSEKLCRQIPANSIFELMSISLVTIAGFSLLTAAVAHPSQVVEMASHPVGTLSAVAGMSLPWQQVLWTGLLSTDLALILELTALASVSSIDAAIVYTAEPVLGAGLAFMFLGERLGPIGMVGAALIVASSLGAQLAGSGEAPEETPAK